MRRGDLGAITTPKQGNAVPEGVDWTADNGCFGSGYPGDDAWIRWLASRKADRSRCAFATAPDVVGDAEATLERSAPYLPVIRRLGYRAALVAQDGLEHLRVPWADFDVLFIGGTTEWKLSPYAARLSIEALVRGLPVHMGRVNSLKRMRHARSIGCSSADGTFVTFGPTVRLPEAVGWVREIRRTPCGLTRAVSRIEYLRRDRREETE